MLTSTLSRRRFPNIQFWIGHSAYMARVLDCAILKGGMSRNAQVASRGERSERGPEWPGAPGDVSCLLWTPSHASANTSRTSSFPFFAATQRNPNFHYPETLSAASHLISLYHHHRILPVSVLILYLVQLSDDGSLVASRHISRPL